VRGANYAGSAGLSSTSTSLCGDCHTSRKVGPKDFYPDPDGCPLRVAPGARVGTTVPGTVATVTLARTAASSELKLPYMPATPHL
jgi:hypothetical protein